MISFKRPIDKLGRIAIPSEIRNSTEFQEKTMLKITLVSPETLHLTIATHACVFCKSEENLFVFRGYHVCRECQRALQNRKPFERLH